jgi:hypothetical protein
MSAKIKLAALAALVTAVSVHAAAFARSNGDLNVTPGHRFNQAINQAGTLPSRSSGNVVYNGQVVGRDPDRNIRVQIMRDD